MLTFLYTVTTIKTDINSQEILMCPNYTFHFKKIFTWKTLRHFLLNCSFPSTYDSFTAQETPGGGCNSWGWLCAHTCPSNISNLCSCSSGHLQNWVDPGIQYQLPVVSQVFFIFQGCMHLVFHEEELWGAEVYTPFLRPVGVLAGLHYCSTVVVKNDFSICHTL